MERESKIGGFTLVELMVTVVILAILTVVAVVSIKGYIRKARTSEAVDFLSAIKLKQETYFATYGEYVDTSANPSSHNDSDFYPPEIGGEEKKWKIECPEHQATYPGWCALGARPTSGETRFQYVTVGWRPGDPDPPARWIKDPTKRWWYAVARGDQDGDGVHSTFLLSSELVEVQFWNETE